MVHSFYRLSEQPFGMTPDPRYLYLSPTHREALASLLYGVASGCGFVALIAKPGMGKTTLIFQLLQHLETSARAVFIFQTPGNARDLMRSLLADLGIDRHASDDLVDMHSKLNEVLLQQSALGKRLVVVIDEAQGLEDSVLEELRMLSNFETPREKLMQIILVGQPQLAEKLASPGLVQLRQRISILSRLQPLAESEAERYIENRLRVAGYDFGTPLFTARALALIAKTSEGIPRNINNICFNALSLGCALQRKPIGPEIILEVLQDLDIEGLKARDAVIPRSQPESRGRAVIPAPRERRSIFSFRLLPVLMIVVAVLLLAFGWPAIKSIGVVSRRLLLSSNSYAAKASAATSPSAVANVNSAKMASVSPAADTAEKSASTGAIRADTSTKLSATPALGETVPVTRTVAVRSGQTLFRISVENLGAYNADLLEKIRELNPWLGDNPDLIEPGDQIQLPLTAKNLKTVQRGTKQTPSIPTAEARKQ